MFMTELSILNTTSVHALGMLSFVYFLKKKYH